MAEHWNGGTGGKGSKPRPYAISKEQFDNKFESIFGEKKKYCSSCGKTFSWCQCSDDNTGTDKNDYQDVLSTEDCFDVESPDPAERSWYYDNYGIKRKK
jgi:hypothetical protein